MLTVRLYRADGTGETHEGRARTDNPQEAISRVAKRTIGYGEIGLCEHFPGGGTYHVQFLTRRYRGSTSLGNKYVAQVS